jgi:hypothetical protein
MQCATHPEVETELACSRCGKAICPRCLVHTPVGARCKDCANVRRVPTYNISTATMVRGIGAAVASGVGVGIAWWLFNYLTYFFLFGLFAGLAVGYAVSAAVSAATDRRAGMPLQLAAAGGVVLAYAVRIGLLIGVEGWDLRDLRFDAAGLIAAAIGVFFAVNRMR